MEFGYGEGEHPRKSWRIPVFDLARRQFSANVLSWAQTKTLPNRIPDIAGAGCRSCSSSRIRRCRTKEGELYT